MQAQHDLAGRGIDDPVAKTHFGFAKDPVLLAQQIADGQQVRFVVTDEEVATSRAKQGNLP